MSFEIITFLLSMTPINELRGTIPIAISIYGLEPRVAFFLAVLGNMVPVFFLLLFWKKGVKFLMEKSKFFNNFFNWFFKRTRKRFYKKYTVYGDLLLILIVAIPLPFTGAWTGTVVSYLFGTSYWKSVILILIGVLIAGLIVTLATMGVINFI